MIASTDYATSPEKEGKVTLINFSILVATAANEVYNNNIRYI